jgi:tetratricopeptide (TPR) repeat protein
MNKAKETIMAILVVLILGSLIVLIFRHESTRSNRELRKRIAELSPRGGPPNTIEGLKQAIALYEAQIERNVKEGAQTGAYWKILAIRLADRGMHRDALDALERAIHFNAEEPVLYYLTGVSAGIVAKSIVGFSSSAENERNQYYKLSEASYLRALELDDIYTRPMYGLGVLYVFELNEPQKGIIHLENYLKLRASDIPAMFVLARAYFVSERFREAIELYERIIQRTKDPNIKTEAQKNIDIAESHLYG